MDNTKEAVEAQIKVVEEIFKPVQTPMINLFSRWLNEKEYEDFKDYENVMRGLCPEIFVKGTKSTGLIKFSALFKRKLRAPWSV